MQFSEPVEKHSPKPFQNEGFMWPRAASGGLQELWIERERSLCGRSWETLGHQVIGPFPKAWNPWGWQKEGFWMAAEVLWLKSRPRPRISIAVNCGCSGWSKCEEDRELFLFCLWDRDMAAVRHFSNFWHSKHKRHCSSTCDWKTSITIPFLLFSNCLCSS